MPPRLRNKKPRLGPGPGLVAAAPAAQNIAAPVQLAPFATAADGAQRHFSDERFADAPISEASKKGIKHEFMSDVQAATLKLALEGIDLLVQAKTGTGKTLAFLLPTIERLLAQPPAPGAISILVLSPTRELACQIEEEARVLLAAHPFRVQHAIGGTNITTELARINGARCDILVATPGRLLDLLTAHGLAPRFGGLRALILDEADRLLDQGFKREIDKIVAQLPNPRAVPRQGLLFSATVSAEIKEIARTTLRPDHAFVSTLHADEMNAHEHVPQTIVTAPFADQLAAGLALLREDAAAHPGASKVMVFFPTARQVAFAAAALAALPGLAPLLEIHSRKSQPARTKAADTFKAARTAVLLSSDVAARGMDFPGVTLVLQLGLPASAEQYVHRLGRTARAGAAGRGVLVLDPAERFFLADRTMRTFALAPSTLPAPALAAARTEAAAAAARVAPDVQAAAYRAWLGYYNGSARALGWDKAALVRAANAFAREGLGWAGAAAPSIEPRAVGMMGLKGVPGVVVGMREGGGGGGRQGAGGGGGGGGGGYGGGGGGGGGNGGGPGTEGGRGGQRQGRGGAGGGGAGGAYRSAAGRH